MEKDFLIKVSIPYVYLSLSESSKDQASLFRSYVKDFIKKNETGLTYIKISGMYALCKLKGRE